MIKYNKDIGVARTGVVTLRAAGWLFLIFINYTTDCPMVNAIWEHSMSQISSSEATAVLRCVLQSAAK